MEFSLAARLGRIRDLLPRFPESGELLERYRAELERSEARLAPAAGRSFVEDPMHDGSWDGLPAPVPSRCPTCGEAPGLSILLEEPETHGGARRLICARCERLWPFPRAVCPSCGEEDPGRLPRLRAEEIPAARIEACDSCGAYLKAIDLTLDARAVPAVDDLATCALDLVARERGYRRIGEA